MRNRKHTVELIVRLPGDYRYTSLTEPCWYSERLIETSEPRESEQENKLGPARKGDWMIIGRARLVRKAC